MINLLQTGLGAGLTGGSRDLSSVKNGPSGGLHISLLGCEAFSFHIAPEHHLSSHHDIRMSWLIFPAPVASHQCTLTALAPEAGKSLPAVCLCCVLLYVQMVNHQTSFMAQKLNVSLFTKLFWNRMLIYGQ